MTEEVPQEAKGPSPYEGKYVVDKPLLVKSCRKCQQPVYYKKLPLDKNERLYCPSCGKFRLFHHLIWLPHGAKMQFVTEEELSDLIQKVGA